ncbi:hypothetical protein T440DRAFT_55384 [Plenodomus tracheiphilus IPT5]|uniref:RNA ligase domain-containing protein n=1 Tax=Plenodomus tracheiphilus IPT5 TaxID=1408161 RepID=A0A6A7B8C6_9PLEO|nr:hypothetical protein T440DRAFT_55384 [Plenodomus tracheiphilus IPT5]
MNMQLTPNPNQMLRARQVALYDLELIAPCLNSDVTTATFEADQQLWEKRLPTLYPKITTHIGDVIERLEHLNRDRENPEEAPPLEPVPIVGTVKLHGTHADIVIYSNNDIIFQSRNVSGLSVLKDNHGFATTMSTKTEALLQLRDLYTARWLQLNPDATLDPGHPVLIAGEWIGEKVQTGVAISHLSKRFVIVSVNINGTWQIDRDYAGISLPNHDIYNIACAGVYTATLYPEDPQRTLSHIESLAEDVATRCPFAATFGIKGEGEGIVWKLVPPQYNTKPALWFKTKGGRFKPTYARPPTKRINFDEVEEACRAAAGAAATWCSQQRLEQGWEVLREKHIEQDLQGLSVFLKWVQQDILTEEEGYIRKHRLDKADLKTEVAKIAKPWYLAHMRNALNA